MARMGMASLETIPNRSIRILWLTIVLGVLQSFISVQHAECFCSSSDSQALLELKGKNSSDSFASWKKGSDCCHGWAGVTCDTTATHVITLNLTGPLQLRGANITDRFCNLHELQVLNISFDVSTSEYDAYGNEYVLGNIPKCLWNMSTEMRFLRIITLQVRDKFQEFEWARIDVQYSLPAQICDLRNLAYLDVGDGIAFKGAEFPGCLGGMTKLEYLSLAISEYTSPEDQAEDLAHIVCHLINLTHLDLVLSQTIFPFLPIPSCFWNMTRLTFLSMEGFMLTSSISSDICKLADLAYLDLHLSHVYGDIPLCIWNLIKLQHLEMAAWNDFENGLYLGASLSSVMCNLKYLSYLKLDLSSAHGYIPDCIWEQTQLEVLQLSQSSSSWRLPGSFSSQMCGLSKLSTLVIPSNGLSGVLPGCIWSMAKLEYLDLSGADLSKMEVPSEASLPSLEYLVLRNTNVNPKLLDAIGKFSALATLDLGGNNINSLPDGIQNLSSLTYLSASSNLITKLPAWISNYSLSISHDVTRDGIASNSLFNVSRLSSLDLSSNHLAELSLPAYIGSESYLGVVILDFSRNSIQNVTLRGSGVHLGEVYLSENLILEPESILNLRDSTIDYLDLSSNCIGIIPKSLHGGSNISTLDLSGNPLQSLSGLCHRSELSYLHLSNISTSFPDSFFNISLVLHGLDCLSQVQILDLSTNNISSDLTDLMASLFHNLPQLNILDLSSNNIFGNLSWFTGAVPKLFDELDISGNQLSGELPRSLLAESTIYGTNLNLSNNQLQGRLPELDGGDDWILDLSRNHFEGPLPRFPSSTFQILDLSGNNLSGPIPSDLIRSSGLTILNISHNRFSGHIPSYLGTFKFLQVLDLTSNNFSGALTTALGNCPSLQHLRVQNNFLGGQIPTSIGDIGGSLLSFTASSNQLEGSIPPTLGNCVNLVLLDLSRNNLSGELPPTLERLSILLRVFSVASNCLSGIFPRYIMSGNFSSLQVLDLSNNSFHGNLPASGYFSLSGFINVASNSTEETLYTDGIQISTKGGLLTYSYFLVATTSFDVSSNEISGHIPQEFGMLQALRYLKLSGNNLSGNIPPQLSNLSVLESLDLSRNSLTGEIPPGLVDLDKLSTFNVSYNHLMGPIPVGKEFNTYNESSFQNNSGLCGFPLPKCSNEIPGAPAKIPPPVHHHPWKKALSQWISLDGFLVGLGIGFGVIWLTFLASKRARGLLYVPKRKMKVVYDYNEPYGAYRPQVITTFGLNLE